MANSMPGQVDMRDIKPSRMYGHDARETSVATRAQMGTDELLSHMESQLSTLNGQLKKLEEQLSPITLSDTVGDLQPSPGSAVISTQLNIRLSSILSEINFANRKLDNIGSSIRL